MPLAGGSRHQHDPAAQTAAFNGRVAAATGSRPVGATADAWSVAQETGPRGDVNRIDRGGGHFDPHLSGIRLGRRNVGYLERFGAAECLHNHSSHIQMLTQTLRSLERDGLLSRTVTAAVPVRVDYELTALGHSLLPVMQAVKDWSETYIENILAARAVYDGR